MSANGVISPHDGDITFIGKVMAALPVDVYIAKLFIFGHLFSVFDEAVIIGKLSNNHFVQKSPKLFRIIRDSLFFLII